MIQCPLKCHLSGSKFAHSNSTNGQKNGSAEESRVTVCYKMHLLEYSLMSKDKKIKGQNFSFI